MLLAIEAIIAVVGVMASIRRVRVGACLVGVSCASPLFAVTVAGLRLHYFVIFGGACAIHLRRLWAPMSIRRRRLFVIGSSAAVSLSAALGSLTNAPSVALLLLMYVAVGLIIGQLCFNNKGLTAVLIRGLVWGIAAGDVLALLQLLHIVPQGLVHFNVTTLGRPSGYFGEPDWLGMFSACGVVLVARNEIRLGVKIRAALLTLFVVCVVFAVARASWLALLCATVLSVRWSRVLRLSAKPRLAAVVAFGMMGIAAVGVLAGSPATRRAVDVRMLSLVHPSAGDVAYQARKEQDVALMALARSAPWHGYGLSASGRVGVSGIIQYSGTATNNVGDDWVLDLLVDAKYLGIPLILVLGGLATRNRDQTVGAALVVVLVNSLFSDALLFPVTWLFVGLVVYRNSYSPRRIPGSLASSGGAQATRRLNV